MTNGEKGGLLGAANVLVVSLGIAVMEARHLRETTEIFGIIAVVGMLPGVLTGIILGKLAGRLSRHRLLVLVGLAMGMVALLGSMFALDDLILLACIPTIAAASILERTTRKVESPPVPPARAIA